MPKIYLPDLVEMYAKLNKLMDAQDIPMHHRLELATMSGILKYYVSDLTKDINVEVIQ